MVNASAKWPIDFPKDKNVLYCCLYWGLGHATRSIPIIQALIDDNNQVTIASDGMALTLLRMQFPQLEYIELQPYDITYPYRSIVANIFRQSFKIQAAIRDEKNTIEKYCSNHAINMIISDNRLGCYHTSIHSVIISHQLSPHHDNAFIAYMGKIMTARFVKKFNSLWIPDDERILLSGALSNYHNKYPPKYFTGLRSRMKITGKQGNDVVVLLSGPEPQRSILEKNIYYTLIKEPRWKIHFVRGSENAIAEYNSNAHMTVYGMLSGGALQDILEQSALVIARSGYTTLIDLWVMQKQAILIPTPGQTEQEYLALHHNQKWPFILQDKVSDDLIPLMEKLLS